MKKSRYRLLSLFLLFHAGATLAATAVTVPTGSWLISTQTQFQMQPKAGAAVISKKLNDGKEIGIFYSDYAYFSTEWFNKQRLYLTDSTQPYLRTLDAFAQWIPNKSAYTLTYDPYALSVPTSSGKNAMSGFLTRLDYVNVLAHALNTTPVIDSVRMLTYIDNGQVLNKGKKLKGKKQITLVAQWHDASTSNQYAYMSITENYTAVPYTLTAAAYVDDVTKNVTASENFLKGVDALPGIVKTPSKLRYLVLEEGQGTSPVATDKVQVNYRGFFPSGAAFDSNTLTSFNLNGVIKGWTEGLQLMKPGAKYRFFVPSELAYGTDGYKDQNGKTVIAGNAALVFDVELVGIVAP